MRRDLTCLVLYMIISGVALYPFPAFGQEKVDRVKEIIANVRANEELFKNLEVRYSTKYYLSWVDNPARPSNATLASERTYRTVFQDNLLYYMRSEQATTADKSSVENNEIWAYDGEYTRSVKNKVLVNKIQGRDIITALVYRPHIWLIWHGRFGFPLSVWLAGGKEFQAHPDGWRDVTQKTEFLQEENVAGLPCVKLDCRTWNKEQRLTSIIYVWLGTTRNYLPVKSVGYNLAYSSQLPIQESTVERFEEISPGVWFPMKWKKAIYDERLLREEKRQVVSNKEDGDVENVTLEPKHDISFFRDIEFPPGAVVYEIKDKKITKSYVLPGASNDLQSSKSWAIWIIVLAVLMTLLACIYFVRRHSSKKSLGAKSVPSS